MAFLFDFRIVSNVAFTADRRADRLANNNTRGPGPQKLWEGESVPRGVSYITYQPPVQIHDTYC